MKRQPIDDGGWFDTDTAERFDEDTYWNGSNHISCATRCQWDHQILFRTRSKRWVLNTWSQWQGSSETWEEISPEQAARWLVANNHEHEAVEAEIAQLEV